MTQPAIAASSMTVDPRAVAGTAALLVAGVLLLLYFYRRRQYILFWCAAWVLTGASLTIAARPVHGEKMAAFAYGVSQFIGILGGLVFVVSADAYRSHVRLRRTYGVVLLPVLLWFVLAPLPLGPASVFAPGHLLIGGALVAAGAAHLWLLREVRLLGAVVSGAMLIVIGSMHFVMVYTVPDPASDEAGRILFTMTATFLLAGLGMQLMTFEDMTYELRVANRQLEAAQADLRELVITDPLTGCRNRRFFDEVIGRELQRHRRYKVPLSLLFVDVNRFKKINDELGHEAGDRVLQQVAAYLRRNVREADFVFRWGGDEFLILLSCREEEARRRGRALQEGFANSSYAATLPAGVGLSIGCTEVPPDATDVMEHVRIADERMYAAKRGVRA
ncbi:MAG TPA: GGDEF domain-containing protein [Vicinamibacterales bacterium]|nr:GGDEF domain-containing protein [Vicinamibacterales bacterium]